MKKKSLKYEKIVEGLFLGLVGYIATLLSYWLLNTFYPTARGKLNRESIPVEILGAFSAILVGMFSYIVGSMIFSHKFSKINKSHRKKLYTISVVSIVLCIIVIFIIKEPIIQIKWLIIILNFITLLIIVYEYYKNKIVK